MSEKSTRRLLLEARFQELALKQEQKYEMPVKLRQQVFRTLNRIESSGGSLALAMADPGDKTAEFLKAIENYH